LKQGLSKVSSILLLYLYLFTYWNQFLYFFPNILLQRLTWPFFIVTCNCFSPMLPFFLVCFFHYCNYSNKFLGFLLPGTFISWTPKRPWIKLKFIINFIYCYSVTGQITKFCDIWSPTVLTVKYPLYDVHSKCCCYLSWLDWPNVSQWFDVTPWVLLSNKDYQKRCISCLYLFGIPHNNRIGEAECAKSWSLARKRVTINSPSMKGIQLLLYFGLLLF
jgi:hypothetical protein